jgi:hypothetical protein
MCIIVTGVFLLKRIDIDLYFSIDSALLAFPFFGIGNIASQILKEIDRVDINNKSALSCIFTGVFCSMLLVIAAPVNGRIDLNGAGFGENIALCYMIGFTGIAAVILLSSWYAKPLRIITLLSNGTLIILAFHGIATSIIFRILNLRGDDLIINPFIGAFVCIINCMCFYISNIYCKKIYAYAYRWKKMNCIIGSIFSPKPSDMSCCSNAGSVVFMSHNYISFAFEQNKLNDFKTVMKWEI